MATLLPLDIYYPFDTGAGATASQASWVNIGSNMRDGGILRTKPNYFRATVASTLVTVQTGAVLIQGVYGESTGNKVLTIPTAGGTFGVIVVQSDFTGHVVNVAYNNGVRNVVQNSGLWEYMLYHVVAGALIDCRSFISPLEPLGQQIFLS